MNPIHFADLACSCFMCEEARQRAFWQGVTAAARAMCCDAYEDACMSVERDLGTNAVPEIARMWGDAAKLLRAAMEAP